MNKTFDTIKKNCKARVKMPLNYGNEAANSIWTACLGGRVRNTTLRQESDNLLKEVLSTIDNWDIRKAQKLIDIFPSEFKNKTIVSIDLSDKGWVIEL